MEKDRIRGQLALASNRHHRPFPSRTLVWRPWAALTVLVVLSWLGTASAATVMNNNDAGAGSLRALIAAASSGDTIDFAPSVTGTIALTSGVLNITKTLTISGPGSAVLTISGSNTSGVFAISVAGSLTVSDLTLSDGTAMFGGAIYNDGGSADVSNCVLSDNTATIFAGAIYNDGPLTVSNTAFINNSTPGQGGAISANAGVVTISDSQFVGNQAGSAGSGGGGITHDLGTLTITRTTFDANTAVHGGGGVQSAGTLSVTDSTFKNNTAFDGGGLEVLAGTATIERSTFSNNTAVVDDGGGMEVNGGTVTIERTTFSSNTASQKGGGLEGPNNSGNLTISNSTVSNNTAADGGGLAVFSTTSISSSTVADNQATDSNGTRAGNIYVGGPGPTIIRNTLVAGGTPWNCYIYPPGTYTSGGHNLDTGTTCGFTAAGDLTNATAGLDVLANYGGPTFTRALLGTSMAANAGDTATCPPIDQRGVARPIGAACDIGAFEGPCGDGNPDPGEVCDDGNVMNGDGCDNNCTITACGNGIVSSGEQCEDGNTLNGDCCDSACQYEATGSPCTGTTLCAAPGQCNGAGSCVGMLRTGCRGALKSGLRVKNKSGKTKDKLIWKWLKGAATMLAEFGSPTTTTEYTLCLYTGTAAAASIAVAPSGALWSPVGTTGLKYKDPARSSDGVFKVLLKAGAANKAKALLKGKGVNLPDLPAGPLTLPVTAQLVNSTNSVCFEGVYDTPDIIKNDAEQFKAKAQ